MPSKVGAVRKRETSSEGRRSPPSGRAHRACEKCTRTKKKCDKALPACSRCSRLAATCCYDFVYTGPSLTIIDQCVIPGPGANEQGSASVQRLLDLVNAIQPDTIMALFTSANVDWRDSVDRYFRNVHPWLSIIHPSLLAARLESSGGDAPQRPELALLLACMHLLNESASPLASPAPSPQNRSGGDSNGMFSSSLYLGVRRTLGLLRATCDPCLELVQCGILLCLYEFGHGEYQRAYVTIGDANTMAQVMKIGPGKSTGIDEGFPVAPEEEERRNIYWGLFVVDRLIHVECRLMWMPLHVPSPANTDLLPSISLGWHELSSTHAPSNNGSGSPFQQPHYSANTRPSVPLGVFQRVAQCAILLDKALDWDKGACGPGGLPGMNSFTELDVQARALIEAMVCQASQVGEYYACFATCTCILLLVYCRFLCTIDPATIHNQSSNVEVLKAIAGINFTVRMIVDTTIDLNGHLACRPDLLDSSSPVTTYSAYHSLRVLSNFDHIITDARNHFHDIYSSLHFFGKKWAVAGHLVDRLETFIHEKDKEPEQFLDPSSTDESDPGVIPLE